MLICNCSLAGTKACLTCPAYINQSHEYTGFLTPWVPPNGWTPELGKSFPLIEKHLRPVDQEKIK